MWILLFLSLVAATCNAQSGAIPQTLAASELRQKAATLDVLAHKLQSMLTRFSFPASDRQALAQDTADFIERLSQIRQKASESTSIHFEDSLKESVEERTDALRGITRLAMLAKAKEINPFWREVVNNMTYTNERAKELCPISFARTPLLARNAKLLHEAANELDLAIQYKDVSFVRFELREMDELAHDYVKAAEDTLSTCE